MQVNENLVAEYTVSMAVVFQVAQLCVLFCEREHAVV